MNRRAFAVVAALALFGCGSGGSTGAGGGGGAGGGSAGGAAGGGAGGGTAGGEGGGSGGAGGGSGGGTGGGSGGGAGGGSSSSDGGYNVPAGFDQLPMVANYINVMEADSNNRLFVAGQLFAHYIDNDSTTWVNATPSNDGIVANPSAYWTSMSRGPDGTVWMAPVSGNKVIRRALGASAWTLVPGTEPDGGFPNSLGISAPGFDTAGNLYLALNPPGSTSAQMYKAPAGTTSWAPYGPVTPTFRFAIFPPPVVIPNGTLFVNATSTSLYLLDATATAYTSQGPNTQGQAVQGPNGVVYNFVGRTTVLSKAPLSAITVEKQVGTGITYPGGICAHRSGDIYVLATRTQPTTSGLWRRNAALGNWYEVPLNPLPTGDALAIACAPNGRIYVLMGGSGGSTLVWRSRPN